MKTANDVIACVVGILAVTTSGLAVADVDFATEIRPVLEARCVSCHGPDDQQSGLRLDYGALLVRGGDRGAAVVAGEAQNSLVLKALRGDGLKQMPLEDEPLTEEEIELIERWINEGAKLPDEDVPLSTRTSDLWSLQPATRPRLPRPAHANLVRNPIDRFAFGRLQEEGLQPSAPADRHTLMRRVYLDLLGILPQPADVDSFVADERPDACDRLVDRLLASPRYGERWGRHWLDVARYADSNGFTIDGPRSIWPYRDWVIRAINADMPFDQFAIEQLAGDLLPDATRDQQVATGFHRNTLINQEGGTDAEQFRVEAVVDRVNTTGTAFLGLTIGCAQCHAHKYDPISQRDFYQLFAVFNDCDEPSLSLPTPHQQAEQIRIAAELKEVNQALAEHDRQRATAQSDWEQQYAALPAAAWTPLRILTSESEGGATINPIDDTSAISGTNGVVPERDVYTIDCQTVDTTITAIRLEALTSGNLPNRGPGLAENGNFVLSELRLSLVGDETRQVTFDAATADWSQEGYSANLSIDGDDKTGWAIGGFEAGSPNVDRELILTLKDPLPTSAGETLQFQFRQQHSTGRYLLGAFRLSVTDQATAQPLVPERIQQALQTPADQRSKAQTAELAAAFAASDQQRAPLLARQNKLKTQESQLSAAIANTMVMRQRAAPRETHIHIRGNFLDHGAKVEPDTPEVLPPLPRSDNVPPRLAFARWLFQDDHPLTARVTVNRHWQRFFGLGLVETENDFGTQGERPSNPELLDWLASEFVRVGWRNKTLHREIVTSAVYCQASAVSPELHRRDPRNRLLARQSRIRLEAEGIRDLALAATGYLSDKMLGPGVYPPQPTGIYVVTQVNKGWPESKGEDRFRRGLYTYFWRSSPYPMLPTFDAPDANSVCTRRNRSNTPLQALTLANDPAFLEFARALADRTLREAEPYDEARLRRMGQLALSRDLTPRESDRLLEFLSEQAAWLHDDPASAKSIASTARPESIDESTSAAWTAVARVILNLDEFITRE